MHQPVEVEPDLLETDVTVHKEYVAYERAWEFLFEYKGGVYKSKLESRATRYSPIEAMSSMVNGVISAMKVQGYKPSSRAWGLFDRMILQC